MAISPSATLRVLRRPPPDISHSQSRHASRPSWYANQTIVPARSRGDCPPPSIGFDEGKKGVLKAAMTRPGLPAQLVQIPLGQESAGDHQADAIGYPLGNVQDVRRHDHGAAG